MIRFLFIALFLFGCSSQQVQPTAPVYNITITHTDNSQTITGENIKAEAISKTETHSKADIKPEVKAEAAQTTKNGLWIVWLVIIGLVLAGAAFVYWKFRK